MIIVINPKATKDEVKEVINLLEENGLKIHLSEGTERTIIGVIGDKTKLSHTPLEILPAVEKIVPIMEEYKLASKTFKPESSVINVKGQIIGGRDLAIIAGPCSVESEKSIIEAAWAVKRAGAKFLRGGAYKPRTSPYAFQGLEKEGLKLLKKAADETGLLIVSEITSENDIEMAAEYIDVIQIGARNSQNFRLLKEAGKSKLPVLIKRGNCQTIDELLTSAEYVMNEGNYNIILCERGIRTFETATRNTLDISAVPVLKSKTHLPVIIDPSHAAGKSSLVIPLAKAAIAAGADGLIVEVHIDPRHALSDAAQQLNPEEFYKLCYDISKIAHIVEREFVIEND